MRSLGGPSSHLTGVLTRGLGPARAPREDRVRTRGGAGHRQAQDRGLGRASRAATLVLDVQPLVRDTWLWQPQHTDTGGRYGTRGDFLLLVLRDRFAGPPPCGVRWWWTLVCPVLRRLIVRLQRPPVLQFTLLSCFPHPLADWGQGLTGRWSWGHARDGGRGHIKKGEQLSWAVGAQCCCGPSEGLLEPPSERSPQRAGSWSIFPAPHPSFLRVTLPIYRRATPAAAEGGQPRDTGDLWGPVGTEGGGRAPRPLLLHPPASGPHTPPSRWTVVPP